MSETKKLRSELTKRGIEWTGYGDGYTEFLVRTVVDAKHYTVQPNVIGLLILTGLTHEQIIAATLGNQYDCDHPEWVEWVDSLNHREVKNIRDAVEKLMHESITLGGSMGPNDNVEDGWNEGTELTKAYIDGWVEAFATLGDADLKAENAKLRKLATHALRHIIEFECEADNREQFQGKPCEWCVYHGSSDCPKIIAAMYGELGIEVDDA